MTSKPAKAELGSLRVHFYHRFFNSPDGIPKSGYLTYELGNSNNKARNIFLVAEPSGIIPENKLQEYREFCNYLDTFRVNGRYGKVKSFASYLNENKSSSQQSSLLAVHMFGPVPVFDTGLTIETLIDNKVAKVRVVVYRHAKSLFKSGKSFYSSQMNEELLIRSLSGNLEMVFKRYYEDVSSRIRDITFNADMDKAMLWSKDVEKILAMSLKSKLSVVAPQNESTRKQGGFSEWQTWRQPGQNLSSVQELRKHFFESNSAAIYTAMYFRTSVLYLINCLYAEIGISSRRDEYESRSINIKEQFNKYFGHDYVESIIKHSPVLSELSYYMKSFITSREENLYYYQISTPWLKPIIKFIRLIYWMSKLETSPETARIFISYHYDVPESQAVAEQMTAYINSQKKGKLKPFMVRSSEHSGRFREKIKAMIWMADKSVAILVDEPQAISSKLEKGFHWIATESEHTIQQGKRTIFLKKDGVEDEFFRQKLTECNYEFLVNDNRTQESVRRMRLAKEWEEHPHIPFSVPNFNFSADYLDHRVRLKIDNESDKLVVERLANRLRGYFSQFKKYQVIFVSILHKMLAQNKTYTRKEILEQLNIDWPTTKKRLSSLGFKGKSAESLFDGSWKSFKNRSISVNKQSYRPIEKLEKNSYQLVLDKFMVALSKSTTQREAIKIFHKIVREIEQESQSHF